MPSEDQRPAGTPGFPGGSAFALVRERWRTDWFFRLGLVLVALVVCAAAFAPWLAPYSPVTGDLQHAYLMRPGARFLLGTDTQGRDVLSRDLYGARLSLLVGVISQAVAVSLGVLLGLVAGYYQRWVDAVVMRLADVTLAFPTLLLLIAVAAAVRPSLPVIFVVIGVVGWAGMARIVRGQVLVLKGSEYVAAARAHGARDRRVLWRHLLPNVQAQVMIAATLGIAGAIMAEAALSFVGLGAQPPTPSWGNILGEARVYVRDAPYMMLLPGLALSITILGLNLVGDGIRDWLDPMSVARRLEAHQRAQ